MPRNLIQIENFGLKKMYRAPSRPENIKPNKTNIKGLLQAARSKFQNQKRSIQQLMNREVRTSALLQTQASQAQLLSTQIEKIKSGIIGPDMQALKNEFTRVLDEGVRSGSITNIASLSRLESTELGKFVELLSNKRNGLSHSFIETIPFFKYTKEDKPEEQICSVCHQEFQQGVECIELECKHLFHKNCITQWLKLKRNCPMCKKEVKVGGIRPTNNDENVDSENVRTVRFDNRNRV